MTIVHVQTILQTTLAELDADGNVINPQNYQQTISVLSEDEFIVAAAGLGIAIILAILIFTLFSPTLRS